MSTCALPSEIAELRLQGLDGEQPVFKAPWEAQAFAMVVMLHERGLFTWTEWADALSAEIKNARKLGDPDNGSTYYQHWLKALEKLVVAKGVSSTGLLSILRDQWDVSVRETPHGEPVMLRSTLLP
jgi:nitrile hydratase accessory protein